MTTVDERIQALKDNGESDKAHYVEILIGAKHLLLNFQGHDIDSLAKELLNVDDAAWLEYWRLR